MSYHAKISPGGKIVLPAALRRELGLRAGDSVVIERDKGQFVLRSYADTVREGQRAYRAMLDQPFSVDEFIADRRAEAAGEE